MSQTLNTVIAVVGIDIGKNSFHIVGHDQRGAIVLRQKWSRGQVETRFANMPPCLVGMEACVGAHHLSRKLKALGHDARLMPAKYVRPYSKGQKNDFRDAEAIAEAVQRLRELDLVKPPGAAEAIDWARALALLGADEATGPTALQTLGWAVKNRDDLRTVEAALPEALDA